MSSSALKFPQQLHSFVTSCVYIIDAVAKLQRMR